MKDNKNRNNSNREDKYDDFKDYYVTWFDPYGFHFIDMYQYVSRFE